MQKFKAYKLTETPEKKIRAEFVDCTLDELDPGNVVVRVAYSDVNYKDALAATGKGKILRRPSCIGGIDFSGTVVSSSDARFSKGDAVLAVGYDLGVAHHGGYSQYARVPGEWLLKLPQGMSPWEAMARALPISPLTRTAPWGHAGRHWPQRMQASSTICSRSGSSPATATASVGQTRTHAKQATHCSASMTKFK